MSDLLQMTGGDLTYYVADRQKATYLAVASLAFLAYDMALTFYQELEYVWQIRQFTTVRALFLVNRYNAILVLVLSLASTLMVDPGEKVCMVVTHWIAFGTFTQFAIAEAILVIRVWAIYERRRSILIFLLLCLAASYGTSIVVAALDVKTSKQLLSPAPLVITGCLFDDPQYFYVPFVCSLAVETILFILMFARTFKILRSGLSVPLAVKMHKDGTAYYALVLASLLFTVIGNYIEGLTVIASTSHLVVAVHACACSRLVLCLRCYLTKPDTEESPQTMSLPRFPLADLEYQERHLYTQSTEKGSPGGISEDGSTMF